MDKANAWMIEKVGGGGGRRGWGLDELTAAPIADTSCHPPLFDIARGLLVRSSTTTVTGSYFGQ